MADREIALARTVPPGATFERDGCRLRFQPFVGVAKVQVTGPAAADAFGKALGLPLPDACREIEAGPVSCAWLGPREWLLSGPEADIARLVASLASALGDDGLAIDLTHGRAVYLLTGPGARDALAAHCPLDLADEAAPIGFAGRSLLGDARLFLSRKPDEQGAPAFVLILDQAMAAYAARMLAGTAPAADVAL